MRQFLQHTELATGKKEMLYSKLLRMRNKSEEELTVALNVSENVGTPSADRAYIHTSRIATLFMIFL